VHTGFWWENLRERGHLVDPGIDGKIIFRWIFWMEDGVGGHGLTDLTQDRDRRQALVNAVMSLHIP
jgi:hypothetical protein